MSVPPVGLGAVWLEVSGDTVGALFANAAHPPPLAPSSELGEIEEDEGSKKAPDHRVTRPWEGTKLLTLRSLARALLSGKVPLGRGDIPWVLQIDEVGPSSWSRWPALMSSLFRNFP